MSGISLTTFRNGMRTYLNDTVGPTYLWPDDDIDRCIKEAVTEHSFMFPARTIVYQDVAAGQTDFLVIAASQPGTFSGSSTVPPAAAQCDVIAIEGVECPVGTALPVGVWETQTEGHVRSGRYAQSWRTWGNLLVLKNAASGNEVGTAAIKIRLLQTYNLPGDLSTETWQGPQHDAQLVYLLALRGAYQMLADWQLTAQGLSTATFVVDDLTDKKLHIDVPPILAALEIELARAIRTRQNRVLNSRTLGN